MLAKELLSQVIMPLKTSDTGRDALNYMYIFHVRHLPIVNNEQLLGLVTEDDIMANDVDEPIGSYNLSLSRPYVMEDAHLYDVMKMTADFGMTIIPVVDYDDNFMGLITQDDLIRYFGKTGAFTEPGGVIVLEMGKHDYSLSDISRVIESENASVLSTFITSKADSMRMNVTIKVNKKDIRRIVASLERYEYEVKASYQEEEYYDDTLQDRYDSLMSYLNV